MHRVVLFEQFELHISKPVITSLFMQHLFSMFSIVVKIPLKSPVPCSNKLALHSVLNQCFMIYNKHVQKRCICFMTQEFISKRVT